MAARRKRDLFGTGRLPKAGELQLDNTTVKKLVHLDQQSIHLACGSGHLEAVQWLMSHGAVVDARDEKGVQPLHRACANGHLDVVQWLVLHGAAVDASGNKGAQPLHLACANGHLEIVQWLMSHGAAVDANNNSGFQPLHGACYKGRLEVVQWLLSQGASVGANNNNGFLPLHCACGSGHLEVAQWLVTHGAAVDGLNNVTGAQPIHCAAEHGHLEVVQWLVSHGAAVDANDNDALQSIHCACAAGHLEVVQWLMSHGAAVDASTKVDQQSIHLACDSGHLEIVKWLVSHGAVVDARDINDSQPLHLACANGRLEVVKWLLSQGVAVGASDINGFLPLHCACGSGHLEVVQRLVSHGAALETKNTSSFQPLELAQKKGHLQVVAFLQRCSRSRRRNKPQAAKPVMSQEEAQRAEQVRQQAERELLAICEGDGAGRQSSSNQRIKRSKKKKRSKNSNQVVGDAGAGSKGKLSERSEVERNGASPIAEGNATLGRGRDAANALLAQTLQEVCSQQPSQQSVASLEASLKQATSADQDLIARATQQRKAIRAKLKRHRNKEHKVVRALEALEDARTSRTCVDQLHVAGAITHADSLVSETFGNALLDAVVVDKPRREEAQIERRANSTAEHEFVALALSQPEVESRSVESPMQRQQDQDDSMLCVVCISNPKRVLLLPCRHMCVCSECCESIIQVEPLCPLCRAPIETHIEAFI